MGFSAHPCSRSIMKILASVLAALVCLAPLAHAADSFEDRMKAAMTEIQSKRGEGKNAFFAEIEKQGRLLLKDFPDKKDPYQMLMAAAENGDPEKARAIIKEIITDKTPADVKQTAEGLLAKMDAVGKPLDIKFKAVDGRDVDLAAMKGKVVLVDFWATWCGPCVAELPRVKEAYDKLHPKGFEIVGISFDQDKSKLEEFVKSKEMAWPQYFDGEGWGNAFGKKYGITGIPAMWLVGKDGNLVDMNARDGLADKVEKLLAK
jgi:thiol-disulfide isomerase/thioredoxin